MEKGHDSAQTQESFYNLLLFTQNGGDGVGVGQAGRWFCVQQETQITCCPSRLLPALLLPILDILPLSLSRLLSLERD